MEKIILKIGENLEDQIYCNNNIEIICEGDNIIRNCIFSNILNDKFIIVKGKIKFESNQFIEMKHEKLILFYNKEINFYSNLFLKCELSLELKINNIIFHKNRIENSSGFLSFNSSNNHFINNEIVNNKNFEIRLLKENNYLCFNFFDYKSSKKSTAIIINSNNNIIKGNQFLNIEYPLVINENNNKILDNDFFNSKVIFSCDFDDGMQLDFIIENNNFIQNKKKFNKKKYERSIHNFNNVTNEDLMKTLIQISSIDEEINKIKDERLIRKIKEEEKKKEIMNDLDKSEMINLLKIDKKLNEILRLSEDLKLYVEKIKKKIN